MKTTASKKLFEAALRVFPGGVNSPVRSFKAVGTLPHFIARARGAKLYDADGNAFVDYVMSWGPLILGHAPVPVVKALVRAAARGTSYGAPTTHEVTLAEMIVEAVPSMERVRLVNSGIEAVMSAIRLARAYTGRDAILKFEGCYHGHADSLLVKAGSGAMTLGIPDSPGVPADLARHTFTAPYNDITAVERLLEAHRGNFACVIVEPVAGNMGVVPPHPDFLNRLRDLTHHYRIVLLFDEAGIAATLNRVGSMMTLFFTPGPVTDYASAKKSDTQAFAKFFRAMLSQGVYLPPSQFEAAFLSTAHTPADLNKTLKAARAAFTKLKIS